MKLSASSIRKNIFPLIHVQFSLSRLPPQSADYGLNQPIVSLPSDFKPVLPSATSQLSCKCEIVATFLHPIASRSSCSVPRLSSSESSHADLFTLSPVPTVSRLHQRGLTILLMASSRPLLNYDDITMGPNHHRLLLRSLC